MGSSQSLCRVVRVCWKIQMFVTFEDMQKYVCVCVLVCVCVCVCKEPRCLCLLRKIDMYTVCEEVMSTDLRDLVT